MEVVNFKPWLGVYIKKSSKIKDSKISLGV